MNGKKAKDINTLATKLLKDWIIKNSNSSEDFDDAKLESYLPKDTHFIDETTTKNNFYTKRWTVRKLKKILKKYESIPENITLEEMLKM
jgi:hypothetical protein|tara:strand:+ start:6842 stop:7108 length:267 start_codon:yes stop_codon:yes gene_type:complete